MKALWLVKHGGPESFEIRESPDPEPARGEARIRVRASGINFSDYLARQGLYPDAPRPPVVLGYEVAGVVDAVGEGVTDPAPGARVLALTKFGGHADTVCAPVEQISALPEQLSFEEGAALPVNYVTAHLMLFRIANLRPGESVLVHMAAGGVGQAALQLCRTVGDVTTFGTASAAKHDALRSNGCTHPIDYRTTDYVAEVRRVTGGKGVDVVLDALGGDDWRKGYSLLQPLGRLVAYGFANLAQGERRNLLSVLLQLLRSPRFAPLSLMQHNRTVSGVNVGRVFDRAPVLAAALGDVLRMCREGVLKPHVDSTFALADHRAAFARLSQRKNVGKVVLVPTA